VLLAASKGPSDFPIFEVTAMIYLVLFLAVLVIDLIPIAAPPAWTVMVLLLVKFDLNPWAVLLVGVPASTLGRYVYSLYVGKIADKLIKRHKREELELLGKKLGQRLWPCWLFVLLYTITPLSTTPLFTSAGMAKVSPMRTLPPFFCGKFGSDAVMVFAGRYAVGNLGEILHGTFSLKGIVTVLLSLLVIAGLLFIDWRALLETKKFKLNFKIWK
jgi:membrane protein DedA with SNARE-associated domain